MTILLGTVNWGRDDTPAHHLRNIKKVAAKADEYEKVFIFVQEIMEGDKYPERPLVKQAFDPRVYDFACWRTMTPFIVKGLNVDHERVALSTKGIAGVTPNRYVASAKVSDPKNPSLSLVGINVHPVQGAFTDPGQTYEAERRAMFDKNWSDSSAEEQKWYGRNESTVRGGDLNDPFEPPLLKGETEILHHSLDQLYFRRPKYGVRLGIVTTGSVNLDIDGHDFQWAEVRLGSRT